MSKSKTDSTMFVIPDTHYTSPKYEEGGIDERAESCVLQAIGIVKPDIGVHIGDVGEWNSVSHWRWSRQSRPPLSYVLDELQEESKYVNEGMDRIDREFDSTNTKERHVIAGNHEVWVSNLIEENHHLRKDWAPENLLRLKERGWKYHKYGKYIPFGKLHLYHGGHYTGVNHARAHALNLSASVMYGHTHDATTYRLQKLGGYHAAWSIGCISQMDKPFLKGRPTNWSHAFAIVHIQKNGKFQVEVIDIVDGICYVYGQRVTA